MMITIREETKGTEILKATRKTVAMIELATKILITQIPVFQFLTNAIA